MSAYYNEFDPKAAAWLRELIKRNLIAPGDVDERSIKDVQPDDLKAYDQVHFFAGIGGWSYALRLAGVADGARLWTGSCPCQPFSSAGKRKAQDDERHLWPAMFRLVSECRPDLIFGEQVASAIGHGWLDGVFADLEREAYTCGAVVLGAHSVGAPHIRQRCWWVADANGFDAGTERQQRSGQQRQQPQDGRPGNGVGNSGIGKNDPTESRQSMPCERRDSGGGNRRAIRAVEEVGAGGMGDANGERKSQVGRVYEGHRTECPRSPWDEYDTVYCRDGKCRRIEPGSFPLAHRVPGRVGLLRGYGNAINPYVAAEFITAYLEAKDELAP